MEDANKIKLQTNKDKYRLYIDGIEVKRITNMQIQKSGHELSQITVTFSGIVETKDSNGHCPSCCFIIAKIT